MNSTMDRITERRCGTATLAMDQKAGATFFAKRDRLAWIRRSGHAEVERSDGDDQAERDGQALAMAFTVVAAAGVGE
jgi:hypothetical protein